MKYYTIYQTTNLINNKIYIGLHTTENINDGYLGSGIFLKKAIKKYGYQNFKKETLFIFDNRKEMVSKEKEIVNEDFVNRKDTYNMIKGGYGLSTLSETKRLETIEKIRKANLERDSTESSRQRIETLLKQDKDIFKKMGKKSSIKQKESYKNGYVNPRQTNNIINIFNSNGELMFSSLQVNFKKICTENNLPNRVLQISYERQGTPIYVVQKPTNTEFEKYKYWYALKNDEERIDSLEYIKNAIESQKIKNLNNNKKRGVK